MATFLFGLKVAVLGLGTVFVALIFLIGLIKIMAKLSEISGVPKRARNSEITPKELVVASAVKPEDDSEVIAVIAAAVACMTQSTVRITTIRRITGETVSAWSAAGRQETINSPL